MAYRTFTDYPLAGSMVDGYDYDAPISFHPDHGWLQSGQFPAQCIEQCSDSGSVDSAVEYWRDHLHFTEALESVRRRIAERYLKDFGAWEDLSTADMETLASRILWIACGDIREQGEWSGLVH